jgi:DNA repair protein RecN (Recombination protein N)
VALPPPAIARTMLEELDIQDFAIAEHLQLRFDPGFNAITGETGAGKSIIIDALDVLLGGRPDAEMVRSGARAARIEGLFSVPDEDQDLRAALSDAGIEPEDGLLIVSRELPSGGRSSARINGRAVVQSTLVALGNRLVDIHSQTEHLAILRPAEHVHYLDRFAGLVQDRAQLAETVAEVRRVRAEIERLQDSARERTRRQDRLTYEIHEIESAHLAPDEEDDLRRERSRLANAEQLAQLAAAAYAAIEGEGRGAGAADALGQAAEVLAQLAHLDTTLSAEAAQIEALQSQATEVARSLRAYREEIEFNPARLRQIEDRLAVLSGLKRKYGAGIPEVIAYARAAAEELTDLTTSEERLSGLSRQETSALDRLASAAQSLSERRREAARRLSEAVERQLADLGLARGRFAVRFDLRPEPSGVPVHLPETDTVGSVPALLPTHTPASPTLASFDRSGVDRVEFLVSLNPGEPPRPLVRVASGGETSRLMLALKTILGAADAVPTLVFDEVDVGVGGRSGRIVGEKLADLARHHQVICITHLAQIASLASRHLTIAKDIRGERTRVAAQELRGDERVEELAAMLGGATPATRASARELLEKPS